MTSPLSISKLRLPAVLIAAILMAGSTNQIKAQWTGGPTGPIYYNGGNVGIGLTTAPASPLHIYQKQDTAVTAITADNDGTSTGTGQAVNFNYGSLGTIGGISHYWNGSSWNMGFKVWNGAATQMMTINWDGNVGIGTTSPSSRVEIDADDNFASGSDSAQLQLAGTTSPNKRLALGYDTTLNHGLIQATTRFASWDPLVLNPNGGNVGIGTLNPANKLSVAGTVQAKEVLVNTSWSDYVFAPDYHLRTLKDTAAYIDQNHHLPEIPSAAEVQEKGVSLGDMQSKLLAKVEELTLHMIQAEARNDRLEQQNQEIREQNRLLRERVARIEANVNPAPGPPAILPQPKIDRQP